MSQDHIHSAPHPPQAGAEEPTAKLYPSAIAVGSLFSRLFRRRPDTRWYSEEAAKPFVPYREPEAVAELRALSEGWR